MKAIKLSKKERELFEQLKSLNNNGGADYGSM